MNAEPGKSSAKHAHGDADARTGKVALLRGGALGDFVLTLPVLQSLRDARPQADVLILAHPPFARLAAPEEMVNCDSAQLTPLYVAAGSPGRHVRDLLSEVDLMLAFSTDGTGILQHNLDRVVRGRVAVCDPRPAPRFQAHIIQHLLSALSQLGVSATCRSPCIRVSESTRMQAAADLGASRRPLIMIHPGSGSAHKCWPADRFAGLAAALRARGNRVVTLSGPADTVTAQFPGPLLQPTDPMHLAAILVHADLFIGNDSGPGHVAAAVGTPTLSLFGPTDAVRWRPGGTRSRVLQAPGGILECLEVDSVLSAALAMLH